MSEISILDPAHPDLITYFKMDAISEGVLTDASGNYDGAVSGAGSVSSELGPALLFSSNADYLENSAPINTAAGFSVSTWVNRNDVLAGSSSDQQLVFSCYMGGYIQIQFGELQSTGLLHVRRRLSIGVSEDVCLDAEPTAVGEWVHIILECSEAEGLALYKNIDLIGSADYEPLTSISRPNFFGSRSNSTDTGAVGILGRTRIFNRRFTAAERIELFEEPLPYKVSGLVSLDVSPLSAEVRLYNASSGALIHTINTDANGEYQKLLSSADPIYVMAIEPNGYRPLVHGPITPVPRTP